jgi:NADH:ubiquinone oxidoreductase subunit D
MIRGGGIGRIKEMRQNIQIVMQYLNQIPNGMIKVDDRKLCRSSRSQMKQSMEFLIHHFKFYIVYYYPNIHK